MLPSSTRVTGEAGLSIGVSRLKWKGRRCLALFDDGPLSDPTMRDVGAMPGRTRKHGGCTRGVCTYSHQHSSFVTTFVDCTYSHQHRRSTSPFWVLKLESIRDQYSLASLTSFAVPSLPAQGRLMAYGGGSGVGTDEMKKGGRRSLLRGG